MKWIVGLFILLSNQTVFPQTEPVLVDHVRHLMTESGLEFGLWGGNGENSPAPILFILASSIDETLGSEYFRQCGNRLAREKGWLCVSIDLPYHGKFQKTGSRKGLDGWADGAKEENDFVADNNARMREVLDYLVSKGLADENNVSVAGTSRGGYLALQFAAYESRVESVIAYAPVIDLLALREFRDIDSDELLDSFILTDKIELLKSKNVWIVIGDRDERVSTDTSIYFARQLSKAIVRGNSKGSVELNVMTEPKGHTTPLGAVDRSVEWILGKSRNNDLDNLENIFNSQHIYWSMIEMQKYYAQSESDVIFLGNSITFWGNWQELTGLANVKNRGIPGDITLGVLNRLDQIISGKPSKIFLLIGINDLAHEIPENIIIKHYQLILDKISSGSPDTNVYFQTLLPINNFLNSKSSIYFHQEQIKSLNASIKRLSELYKKVRVVDLYDIFVDQHGKLAREFTWDGVHLNKKGYNRWFSFLNQMKYLQ